MKTEKVTKVAIVRSSVPSTFEREFNEKMEELAQHDPKFSITDTGAVLSAVITYHETQHFMDSIADEFHYEGIRYLCRHCPYLDDPHDKRVKRCSCRYAEYGMTHKDHEACELFYRQVKLGKVIPLEDYER